MRPELRGIWDEYAAAAGAHDAWPVGAVYMRESKREQVEGFSPAAQLKGTLEEARRRALWIPAEHVFLDAISGRREERPAFGELLAIARAGRIIAVLVLHTSRWARNALISRRWKDELRARGVDVVALNAPFDVARPEGKFAERMMEAVDEFTSDTIGFWVRVGLREKHEQGHPLGRLPETFMRGAGGAVTPHPELSAVVLEGARRYLAGDVGFGDLARWSHREGHRTPAGRALTDEWWRNTLANPLNAGYVGYRRKRGGTELRKAAIDGFMPLETYQALQETRRRRTRTAGHPATFEVYILSGATCGSCGERVVASQKGRIRCRAASQHKGCAERSVSARELERTFGEWLSAAVVLPTAARTRLAALVRAKARRGADVAKAERVRVAIKRLTDAFTWGGVDEGDYREQLATLRAQLERSERVPDERRILEAVRLAQDIPRAWAVATSDQRRRMVWSAFERITVREQSVVAVRPRAETAPLLALGISMSLPRSRPGSTPGQCDLAGVVVEGVEELVALAEASAG